MTGYKIYGAGKTWMAPRLKMLRDNHGFNMISRWIDHPQTLKSFDDEHAPEVHEDKATLGNIWDGGCLLDTTSCDYMALLAHPRDEEKHSGSLVELGIVTGQGKPVYVIGSCASFEGTGHSDRAFMAQTLIHWQPKVDVMDDLQLLIAMRAAQLHYFQNYDVKACQVAAA